MDCNLSSCAHLLARARGWAYTFACLNVTTYCNSFSQTEGVWINETCLKAKIKASVWKTIRKTQYNSYEEAFSILLQTQMVHLEVSFIIYSSLSTPPYFCSTFCGNFWKVRENIPVFEKDSQRLFKIIFPSLYSFSSASSHNSLFTDPLFSLQSPMSVGDKKRKENAGDLLTADAMG